MMLRRVCAQTRFVSLAVVWLCFASAARAQTDEPAVAAAAAPALCGPAEFSAEVLLDDDTTDRCPKPLDPAVEALRTRLDRTASKDAAVFFDVLRALRDHCLAQASAAQAAAWQQPLAQHIDASLRETKQRSTPSAAFAALRTPTAELDPQECLFVAGDRGQPGYACFVVSGAARPDRGLGASYAVYELRDFADAYAAYRAFGVAYAAMIKLDVPALDQAIKRLELASKRWSNLRQHGYLQYPWELAISGAFTSYRDFQACHAQDVYCTGEQGLDPERTRLIALHPGVGMGFQGFGWKQKPSPDATLSLSLEVVGATRYGDDFDSYMGASLGVVVDDGDFRDVRPGVFVHVTRWFHAGYLLSLFRDASRFDATLFLSMDLASAWGASFLH